MARRRKKKRSLRTRFRQGFLIIVLAAVALGWGVAYGLTWPGFRARAVRVSGTRVVDPHLVRQTARVVAGDNIWLLNPWAVTHRVEAIPYVDRAYLKRMLPNIVDIDVTERRPEGCIVGTHGVMTIDATERILETQCNAPLVYDVPSIVMHKPGETVDDPLLTRLRTTAAMLMQFHLVPRAVGVDRDSGIVVDCTDGVRFLLGDDTGMIDKMRLIGPILAAATTHGQSVAQLDLRAVDTPVVRYRETIHSAQKPVPK